MLNPFRGWYTIMPELETFVESNVDGRLLYFDENKLKWQYVNNNNPSRTINV